MKIKALFDEVVCFLFAFIFATLLFILQVTVNAFILTWVVRFDFILIFALFLFIEPRIASIMAFFLAGLFVDFLSGGLLGRYAICSIVTILIAIRVKYSDSVHEEVSPKIEFLILSVCVAIADALICSVVKERFLHRLIVSSSLQVCISLIITFFIMKLGLLDLSRRKNFVGGSSLKI